MSRQRTPSSPPSTSSSPSPDSSDDSPGASLPSSIAQANIAGSGSSSLKRTCDACAASKVKCSGTHPCSRCSSRGLDCFYRARKKRVSTKSKDAEKDKRVRDMGGGNEPLCTSTRGDMATTLHQLKAQTSTVLQPYERRSWTVFFSLYKNYTTVCARVWFEKQLVRLMKRLEKLDKPAILQALKQWITTMDIDFNKIRDRELKCALLFADPSTIACKLANHGWLHLHVHGDLSPFGNHEHRLLTPTEAAQRPMEAVFGADSSVARLKLTTTDSNPNDLTSVEVNPAFETLFGLSQDVVNTMISNMGTLLLPWGGDMLCLVVPDEADIFAFIQICAINLNFRFIFDQNLQLPMVREVPSAHVIPMLTTFSPTPIPCLLRCIHKEVLEDTGVKFEMTMLFEPMVSHPSSIFVSGPVAKQEIPAEHINSSVPVASSSSSTVVAHPDKGNVGGGGGPNQYRSSFGGFVVSRDPDEVIFPDIDTNVADDDIFVREILDFARLADDDRHA